MCGLCTSILLDSPSAPECGSCRGPNVWETLKMESGEQGWHPGTRAWDGGSRRTPVPIFSHCLPQTPVLVGWVWLGDGHRAAFSA